MSDQPKRTPYIYQQFGMQNKEHWESGRIYTVATDSMLTTLSGLTAEEAKRVLRAVTLLCDDSISA